MVCPAWPEQRSAHQPGLLAPGQFAELGLWVLCSVCANLLLVQHSSHSFADCSQSDLVMRLVETFYRIHFSTRLFCKCDCCY